MLLNAGQTADKVADAVKQVQQTMDSESRKEITRQMRSLVDHAAWRLFQLSIAIFLLLLIYRYIGKKFARNT